MSSRSGVRRGAGKMGYSLSLRTSGHSRGSTRGNGCSLSNMHDACQCQSTRSGAPATEVAWQTTDTEVSLAWRPERL